MISESISDEEDAADEKVGKIITPWGSGAVVLEQRSEVV